MPVLLCVYLCSGLVRGAFGAFYNTTKIQIKSTIVGNCSAVHYSVVFVVHLSFVVIIPKYGHAANFHVGASVMSRTASSFLTLVPGGNTNELTPHCSKIALLAITTRTNHLDKSHTDASDQHDGDQQQREKGLAYGHLKCTELGTCV
jgi:hypothetical protein